MKQIASFQVDHTKFGVGLYLSRIDGDIKTYDIRMVRPNGGHYLSNPSLHTIEHIFATFARSSKLAKDVIYVGPMGCRTGFYLLVRDLPDAEVIKLVYAAMVFIRDFQEDIPGCSETECGNYLEHDLVSAKKDVLPIINVLAEYSPKMLDYNWHFEQKNY
jgi:S-ribosylhomocysteine lyase